MHTAKKAIAIRAMILIIGVFACTYGIRANDIIPPQGLIASSPKTETTQQAINQQAITNKASAGGSRPVRLPTSSTKRDTLSGQRVPAESAKRLSPTLLNSHSFKIPFKVDSGGENPLEVRLYVSNGESGTWEQFDSKPPSSSEFAFVSETDGVFLFATRTIDSQGSSHPSGPIEPQLKVVIDTTAPLMTLEIDSDSEGRVRGRMNADDVSAIKETHFHYATDVANQWSLLTDELQFEKGSFSFTPKEDWRELTVHVTVIDAAGNQSTAMKRLHRPRIASIVTNHFAANQKPAPKKTEAHAAQFRLGSSPKPAAPINVTEKKQSELFIRPAEVAADDQSSTVIKLDREQTAMDPAPKIAQINAAPDRSPLNQLRGGQAPLTGTPPIHRNPNPQPQTIPATAYTMPPSGLPNATQRPISTPPSLQFQNQPNSRPVPNATAFEPSRPPARGQLAAQPQSPELVPRGNVVELPAPATAEQVGNAFGLTPPQLNHKPAEPQTPSYLAPIPPNEMPQPSGEIERPKTAAEAMRPLDTSRPTRPTPPNLSTNPPSQKFESKSESETYSSKRQIESRLDSATFGGRVPTRFSDSNRFSLEYELEAVGSIGVDSVELYGSIDDGKNWKFWGQDPDKASPFDIETKEEGVFGFRIVVVSANGLASPRPLASESPDIVVVVDKQKPVVRITGANYGEGDRTGSLVIRYECVDANPMARPITLSFSDRIDGPWTTIAAGLRNDGDYVWPADPQLPRQLFLRIDATDNAGNVGTYILDRPIDAQGLAPRARIRGFTPLSGLEPNSAVENNEQTAKRPRGAFK